IGRSERFLDRAEDQCEGGTKLVADIRKERRFCSVKSGERLRSLFLLAACAGVFDGRCRPICDEIDESFIIDVEREMGTQTDNDIAEQVRCGCVAERQDDGLANGLRPGLYDEWPELRDDILDKHLSVSDLVEGPQCDLDRCIEIDSLSGRG